MELFDVYPLLNIEIERGNGCYVFDKQGNKYLDMYGGHAVVSIGHTHPTYVKAIDEQINRIGFYSNSIINPLQSEFTEKLGKISGYQNYSLFLVNSGAEANENALKLASFHNGRKKILTFNRAFHGRTTAAVRATDNPKIVARVNEGVEATFVELNDKNRVTELLQTNEYCAVIIEGIQGVGGVRVPNDEFLQFLQKITLETETILILDEIQSGYGRSGKFFAHQYAEIKPDIITVAKGMGNGFPIGGVIINPKFRATHGMLGTTFGGNHLAMSAANAVLDVINNQKLIENAKNIGEYLISQLKTVEKIVEVRGRGLMIGIEFETEISNIRKKLIFEEKIFTGVSGTNTIRLLPPLLLTKRDADTFLEKFRKVISNI